MTRHLKIKISLGVLFLCLILALFLYILPYIISFSIVIIESQIRNERAVNYRSYTTPLSKEVVEDLCSKLEIQETSEHCVSDAVVYGPDFFDEIEA